MSAKRSILPGKIPPPIKGPVLRPGQLPPERNFTFSFRYWQQRECFGLGNVDVGWYMSLLTRLCDLSKEKVARFVDDLDFQDAIRYHIVDWDHRNVPLQRQDLNWLPHPIRENEDEFPIYQIHISRAVGRIHGFWDSEYCFNVILLDPLHNLQPSKDVGYVVRPTTTANCEYTSMAIALEQACALPCADANCQFYKAVNTIHNRNPIDQCIVIAGVSPDVAAHLRAVRQSKNVSISEIVEHGITFFE